MPTPIDTEDLERRARALLDDRIEAVRTLATARQAALDKREEADEAERADSTAYQAALRAGWTADELKKVGFEKSARKAPGRPRRARSTAQPSANGDAPDGAPSPAGDGHEG